MNIVIVNHYAGGPSLGMEFRPYYMAREWMRKGHRVLIVGASFSHLRTVQPEVVTALKYENIDQVEYLWLRTNRYFGNGIGRILSMFLFTLRLFFRLRKELITFNPDLIIASSTYPLDNFPVKYLAKKFDALHCYEVHDLWPLSPMELGGYSKYHPFILIMQWAENFAYKNADFVISMLPKTLDHMISHGLDKNKFRYIPNGIALDEWSVKKEPIDHIKKINELKIKKRRTIVGYVGGHAISNALEYLIAAAELAKVSAPYLRFVLVGNGSEKNTLIALAKKKKLDNILFLHPVSKWSIPALLASMDILYLGWRRNPLYRFGISPNKLIDYMMSAKPIVHSVEAGNDIVKEADCGISVEPENPEQIVDALIGISKMDEFSMAEMGNRGKEFVLKYYNYEKLAEDFLTFASKKLN